MVTVPKLWPGSTIACVATGPSLTPADVDYCRGRALVVAVKDAIRLCPWADVLYACDARWWMRVYPNLPTFAGPKYSVEPKAAPWADVLKNTGELGLETDPMGLRVGRNSGYQAINLAVHLGAKRIVLLGYDMQPGPAGEPHWFGAHPWPTRSWSELGRYFRPIFESLVEPLRVLGIQVVNCTRSTALDCFPRLALEDALP